MIKIPSLRLFGAAAVTTAAVHTPALLAAPLSLAHPTTPTPAATAELKRTQLYDFHVSQKAKMVPFAGWSLPVQYTGVFPEHQHTRQQASLFDVSHMGQVRFFGPDRERFMEWVTVADIEALPTGKGRLSIILNDAGGIKDDLIVTRYDDHIYCVINAGRAEADLAYFAERIEEFKASGGDVTMVVAHDLSLIALQGPAAVKVLSRFVEDLDAMPFMASRAVAISGIPVQVMRCGYTGEDGFELSVASADVQSLVALLCEQPETKAAGLGARDSLRIEVGLCLYGNELTEMTTPMAAGLGWTITKRRMEEGNFVGHAAVRKIKAEPGLALVRRVGIISSGPCAREGTAVHINGTHVGDITSGCPSPTLGKNVAQAYVTREFAKPGTEVTLTVRNRKVQGVITKMPFASTNYKAPSSAPTTTK